MCWWCNTGLLTKRNNGTRSIAGNNKKALKVRALANKKDWQKSKYTNKNKG